MERKTLTTAAAGLAFAQKAGDGDPGEFTGYASVFGGVDSYGDTIEPGAYADGLAEFLDRGFICVDHDWGQRVGMPMRAEEDAKGLLLTARFHSDECAQMARARCAERVAAGKFVGLSIGYEAMGWEMEKLEAPTVGPYGEPTDLVRHLTKIKLYEVSLVAVPADAAAEVTTAKGDLRYADHGGRVLADVRAFLARSRSLIDLRARDGRALAEPHRDRLRDLADALAALEETKATLDALLREGTPEQDPAPAPVPAPEPAKADPADARRLLMEFERVRARLAGVRV